MTTRTLHLQLLALALASLVSGAESLQQGGVVTAGGGAGVIKLLNSIPVVHSTYSDRMIWQKDDPRLRTLRDELRLDEMIKAGMTEFDRQLQLTKYVNHLWEYGDPRPHMDEFNPVKIIEYQRQEQRYYCEHYACTLSGTAAAMGWVCRLVSHNGHTWCEMWSNQFAKWVYIDPNNNHYVTNAQDVPMSDAEVRDDWYRNQSKNSTWRSASTKNKKEKGGGFDGRKDVIGFHPNTNLLDQRFDYEKLFMIRDEFSKQTKIRGKGEPVKDSLKDPYFPINQAALTLQQDKDGLVVAVDTMTPNFKTFRARVDNGAWRTVSANFAWKLHSGDNVLEVKSVNTWEVDGPTSRVEVEMKGGAATAPSDFGTPAPEEATKVAGMLPLKAYPEKAAELKPTQIKEKLKSEWIGRWFTKGHWIEYVVEVPTAGKFTTAMIYSSSYYPQREIKVNGQAVPGLESIVFSYTGGWGSAGIWAKADLPVPLDLKAGKNTIRLTCLDQTSFWLKLIRLTASGGTPIDVSALSIAAEGGGKVQKTFTVKNSEIEMFSSKGHWAEWSVEAPAGEYEILLAQGALLESVRQVRLNGELITPTNEFKVGTTGGWRVFTESSAGKGKFKEGKNIVRLENMSDDCPNITYLKFIGTGGNEIVVKATAFTAEGGEGKKLEVPTK